MTELLIETRGLTKHFVMTKGLVDRFLGKKSMIHALDDVNLKLFKGETLGLVGESGCGKTTLGKCILRLIEPTAGEVYFKGQNMSEMDKKQMKNLRKKMQMIFQNPFSSLDPRMKVKDILCEPLRAHNLPIDKLKIQELMEVVNLSLEQAERYPHEFSGGQKQRIGIARALALNPEIIIADEPVSALDVSVQAKILNLMQDLQIKFNLSYIFIAHDISVIKHVSNRIAVMYLGKIVEIANKKDLFTPFHPYTKILLSSVPVPNPNIKKEKIIPKGEVPSPIDPPPGCRFISRCPYPMTKCKDESPELVEVKNNHFVSCFRVYKSYENF